LLIATRNGPFGVVVGSFNLERADVRFAPDSGHVRRKRECPLWAKSGLKSVLQVGTTRARKLRVSAPISAQWSSSAK